MYDNRDRIPLHLHIIYGFGNLALNGLNFLWFSKMFAKMVARLHGEDEPKRTPVKRQRSEEKEPLLRKVPETENEAETEAEAEGGLTLPASPPSPVATVPKEAL